MRMKTILKFALAVSFVFLVNVSTAAQGGVVCGDPKAPCKSPHKEFAPYELSFKIPTRIRANTDYTSQVFFAVLLKRIANMSDEDCDQREYGSKPENERKRVQAQFPDRKVFASFQCPDMGAVSYMVNGKNDTSTFLAIYGGQTQAEAEDVLAKVKAKYPSASVKRMQVVFEQIEQ